MEDGLAAHYEALHDGLTGLPQGVLIVDRAEHLLARARATRLPIAALLVDINDFASVNALHGRGAGDALLRAVAVRLKGVLRETDTVGRIGGDDFIVLTEGMTLADGPESVAERLTRVMSKPFHLPGFEDEPILVSASIGIAVGERPTAIELLRDAEAALSEAKSAAKFRFAISDPAALPSPPRS
jgi:diguanylate cyclase (GGDEF)-like protein